MGILRGTHYQVDNLIKWFQVDIKQDRRECQALMYPTHEGPQMQSLPCTGWNWPLWNKVNYWGTVPPTPNSHSQSRRIVWLKCRKLLKYQGALGWMHHSHPEDSTKSHQQIWLVLSLHGTLAWCQIETGPDNIKGSSKILCRCHSTTFSTVSIRKGRFETVW